MKKLTTLILLFILFISNPVQSFSQQIDTWLEKNEVAHYRKVYLHTDREFYFLEDTIRLKAYYLNGQTQQFIPGFYNLYISLIDKEGEIVSSDVLPIDQGIAGGNLGIPDNIQSGNYMLRAYTNFQKEIGEEAFFYKTIKIDKPVQSADVVLGKKINNSRKIDLAFLPEGGILLEGESNIVGLKAIDENGKGISVQGEILNSKGESVSIFKSSYKGMGKLYLRPQPGETYTVKLKDYTNYSYEFKDIKKEGIKIEIKGKKDDNLLVHIITNSELLQGEEFYFAVLSRGKVLYHNKFVQKGKISQIRLNKDVMLQGINKLVLLDKQLKPISERLYFSNNFSINDINISLNNEKFNTRSAVNLELFDDDENREGEYSNLSISVVNKYAVNENGPAYNILSSLLIDSELKGNIESPADFFTNDKLPSKTKLNLLMLTQGWSQYIWDLIPEIDANILSNRFEGITIKGNVNKLNGKGPVKGGDVSLGIISDGNMNLVEGKTDEDGKFSFDSIVFIDEAELLIKAKNKSGKLRTEVFLDPIFDEKHSISKEYFPSEEIVWKMPKQIYDLKYTSYLASNNNSSISGIIEQDEILIEESEIKEKRNFEDGNSFKIKDSDLTYSTVLDYLRGRVAGVSVSNSGIVIRGESSLLGSSAPLILLDNASVPFGTLQTISMSDIDRVEVLKNASEIGMYGVRGAGGVVKITSKTGKEINYIDPPSNDDNLGTLKEKIVGYSSYKEFYSPKYSPQNFDSTKPDHRITLYWNPNINTLNGKALVSFFTSEDISTYKIFVEGISSGGKICIGTAEFKVE